MRKGRGHLSDDRLLSICLAEDQQMLSPDRHHLRGCAACARRLDIIAGTAGELGREITHWADEAFPPDRLARQRQQILRRLERLGQPARVLEFPHKPSPTSSARGSSGLVARWVTAAAAMGLIVGIGAGVLFDHRTHVSTRASHPAPSVSSAIREVHPPVVERASPSLSDDEFLSAIEAALGESHAPELAALAAFTPRIQEIALSVK